MWIACLRSVYYGQHLLTPGLLPYGKRVWTEGRKDRQLERTAQHFRFSIRDFDGQLDRDWMEQRALNLETQKPPNGQQRSNPSSSKQRES
jgi:hypothetical protein